MRPLPARAADRGRRDAGAEATDRAGSPGGRQAAAPHLVGDEALCSACRGDRRAAQPPGHRRHRHPREGPHEAIVMELLDVGRCGATDERKVLTPTRPRIGLACSTRRGGAPCGPRAPRCEASNILLCRGWAVKIADFGTLADTDRAHPDGTAGTATYSPRAVARQPRRRAPICNPRHRALRHLTGRSCSRATGAAVALAAALRALDPGRLRRRATARADAVMRVPNGSSERPASAAALRCASSTPAWTPARSSAPCRPVGPPRLRSRRRVLRPVRAQMALPGPVHPAVAPSHRRRSLLRHDGRRRRRSTTTTEAPQQPAARGRS